MHKKQVSRRDFLRLASVSVAGATLAACVPQGAPSASDVSEAGQPAADEKRVIKVTSGQDVTEIEVRQLMADQFNEEHDDIHAEVVIVKGNRFESQQTMIAGGNAPDVLYLNPGFMYTFAAKGVLLDHTPFVERDNYTFEGIYPLAVEMGQFDGKLVATPFEIAPLTVVYNEDLFEAAGVAPPPTDWEDPTWTWDAFVEMAAQLTDLDNGQYGAHIDNWMFTNFAFQNGGSFLSNRKEIREDTICVFDSPEGIEAIQWLVDLRETHQVMATDAASGELSGFDRFMSGKLGMYVFGRWLNTFRTIEDFSWNVAALPHPEGKPPASLLLDLHYAIYSGSKEQDASWEYLKFILTEGPQSANVSTGMAVAALEKVNSMPVFLDSHPPENEFVYIDALKYARPEDVNPATQSYGSPMWAELSGVFAGTTPVAEGVTAVAAAVNQVLDEWKAENL